MPDPDRLLRTLDFALRACRTTPGRRGRTIVLEQADEVLVAGDLHGNVENFRKLLHHAQLGTQPRRHVVLQELIHGPHSYPAGGDKSHQLVDLWAALKSQFPDRAHLLLANHELSQCTRRGIMKEDQALNALFREGLATAYGPRAKDIYDLYMELFAIIPVAIKTPNGVYLSHSLPNARNLVSFSTYVLEKEPSTEEDLKPGGSIHSLVWGRDISAANVSAFLGKVGGSFLITGHITCMDGYDTPNEKQIILDCSGTPGCCCLFPANQPLTHEQLVSCVRVL
jgi:hypothetical protein